MVERIERINLARLVPRLNILAILMLAISMLVIFFYAPTEQTMGNVQRIFYFHVGTAWVAAVAFFVALISGVAYLRKPSPTWDMLAVGSVEIGLVFTSMTIVSGSVWGRPAWGTWWTWSPRLTSITVLWLVYAAYFMLRGAVEDEERRGRFSAVYVIAGFVTVIITFLSIRLLLFRNCQHENGHHPKRVGPDFHGIVPSLAGQSDEASAHFRRCRRAKNTSARSLTGIKRRHS